MKIRRRDLGAATLYKKIFWSGYTNGWLGYLPTAKAYEEGGYETRNTPLSPESEELILDICDSEIKNFD